jgi:ribosomal protein L40E
MKCPGQDSRYWGPEAIFETSCPNCGAPAEFFKDEGSRKCRKCSVKILNPKMDFGCAAYCKFAAQCLGDLPPELAAKQSELLKDRVAAEVKKHLGRDFRRIARALKVVEYAGRISQSEGTDRAVVTLAAYLSAVVEAPPRREAAEAAQSSETGRQAAEDILRRCGASEELAAEVLEILRELGSSEAAVKSANFRVVHDAVRITRLEDVQKEQPRSPEEMTEALEKSFLTESGRKTAGEVFEIVSSEDPN